MQLEKWDRVPCTALSVKPHVPSSKCRGKRRPHLGVVREDHEEVGTTLATDGHVGTREMF